MNPPANPPSPLAARRRARLSHVLKNTALIALSLILLPLSAAITCITIARQKRRQRGQPPPAMATQEPPHRRRTVLVTGVGMAKGLALARLFRQAGHRVIGADFSRQACGGRSKALDAYYPLRRPGPGNGPSEAAYVDALLWVVQHERVDLWVSCSGVASAMEDAVAKEIVERRTGCKCVQPGVEATRTLHEKGAFMAHTRDVVGLRVPESHLVRGAGEMMEVLEGVAASPGSQEKEEGREDNDNSKRFIAKSVGMNDRGRGDMTLLPLGTMHETSAYVGKLAALGMSDDEPWLLQEYIHGREYCTHSLVVRGEVRAFTACVSSELLMHYVALDDASPLTQAMLEFTRKQARSFGDEFTGHLSFDFIIKEPLRGAETVDEVELYPIECNPRAHTAVVLFADTPGLVEAYLSILEEDKESSTGSARLVTPERPRQYYWVGHDLVSLALIPTAQLVLLQISPLVYVRGLRDFFTHLTSWTDGTWASWDPLPWFWLYHVYWPLQFLDSLVMGNSWSRVNVSTTKMFECE